MGSVDSFVADVTCQVVVIEAPGKRRHLQKILSRIGIGAEVMATGGHFYASPQSLYPLAVNIDWTETERHADPIVAARLRRKCAGHTVAIATDRDAEGEVIARDVWATVGDVARSAFRVHFPALTVRQVTRGFSRARPVAEIAPGAGDARRIIDRVIGHAYSGDGIACGRVSSAALGWFATHDPEMGIYHLRLAACDGGADFMAHVRVTESTARVWASRFAQWQRMGGTVRARPRCVETDTVKPAVFDDWLCEEKEAEVTR